MKPAGVRFYFDADILGLGRLVAGLRADATYPGDPGTTIHKRRLVVLSSPDAGMVWGQLEVILIQWRRIEDLAEQPGPFIYTATRTLLRKIA